MIRDATPEDAEAICEIYNHYIENTVITFAMDCVNAQTMRERILSVSAEAPWLVYELEGVIVGYVYAAEWKTRCAFRHCMETSIYLKPDVMSKGIGTALYAELLERMKQTDIHIMIGCIALPNAASVALHEKFGFEKVGHFKEVGRKFDEWVDIGYWQLMLNPKP